MTPARDPKTESNQDATSPTLPPRPPPRPPPAPLTARLDVYDRVTNRIVELLDGGGPLPWVKPWHAEHLAGRITRPLRHTGEPYNGINVLTLWIQAEAFGYVSPLWLTYNQARELGGHVRKGEKGSPVVYAGKVTKEGEGKPTPEGDPTDKEVFFLREYTVFNADQCDELPERFKAMAPVPGQAERPERLPEVEAFFSALGIPVEHGGNQASYNVERDRVRMPQLELFRDAVAYYATLSHEATHATRHPSRLARELDKKRFPGDEVYAMEELVAELGAAFLCADLGLVPEPREETAAYLQGWLKVLKNDKRAIFTAAAAAQKAVEWCHGRQV